MINRMENMCSTQLIRKMKHVMVYVVENEVNEGCLMDMVQWSRLNDGNGNGPIELNQP